MSEAKQTIWRGADEFKDTRGGSSRRRGTRMTRMLQMNADHIIGEVVPAERRELEGERG